MCDYYNSSTLLCLQDNAVAADTINQRDAILDADVAEEDRLAVENLNDNSLNIRSGRNQERASLFDGGSLFDRGFGTFDNFGTSGFIG